MNSLYLPLIILELMIALLFPIPYQLIAIPFGFTILISLIHDYLKELESK